MKQATEDCDLENAPLITIGIACYNAKSTILRAFAAAMSQSWPNFEVVIVDDCSDDGTWELIQGFAAQHKIVRVYQHKKNSWVGTTYNSIVAHAEGEFIAFFDDDDVSKPERLIKQYERLTAYERDVDNLPVMCFSNRDVVDYGDELVTKKRLAIGRFPQEPCGEAVANFQLCNVSDPRFVWGTFGACTLFVRRSLFEKIGPFETRVRRCSEIDFEVRTALMGGHFISVDEALVTQHMLARPHKAGRIELDSRLFILEKHKDYLERRSAYFGATAMTHAHFHGERGHRIRRLFWYIAALITLPSEWRSWRIKSSSLYRRLRSGSSSGAT